MPGNEQNSGELNSGHLSGNIQYRAGMMKELRKTMLHRDRMRNLNFKTKKMHDLK